MSYGDHIQIYRGGYYHHGIDLGDGTIIHFSGEPLSHEKALVKRSLMVEFMKGDDKYAVIEYPASICLPPETTVGHAFSMLGATGYNLVFRNCEHFATYCKTGDWKSQQIRSSLKRMANLSRYGLRNPWLLLVGPAMELIGRGSLMAVHKAVKLARGGNGSVSYKGSLYTDAAGGVYLMNAVGRWGQMPHAGLWYPDRTPQLPATQIGHLMECNGSLILAAGDGYFTPDGNGQWIRIES